ncbi:hypothetical protein BDV25DRAFT_6594 [Aspergillus avenaceus]|uniref:Uncharacterized protein n=1 Tax=Aspergillus avenaceus TaxID=36643 RepID=A0A5N6TS61_ASPAV|nr:hypothetical protein BDV25DRAFT_6594 [Aspergillus avenaceus]
MEGKLQNIHNYFSTYTLNSLYSLCLLPRIFITLLVFSSLPTRLTHSLSPPPSTFFQIPIQLSLILIFFCCELITLRKFLVFHYSLPLKFLESLSGSILSTFFSRNVYHLDHSFP